MKQAITVETLAAMGHQANREYCMAFGETHHLPWDQETESEKAVSIDALRKFLDTPMTGDPAEYAEQVWGMWKTEKLRQGWVYGPVKDREAKTHPCLVESYAMLSEYEKVKDLIYLTLAKLISTHYEVVV